MLNEPIPITSAHPDEWPAALELALKLGPVEGGAYDEAVKAKQQREQKLKD